jgi:hypothetical protein
VSATTDALTLERKIPLGEVAGRIDHLAVELAHNRLFVAELGNNSVGVLGIAEGKLWPAFSSLTTIPACGSSFAMCSKGPATRSAPAPTGAKPSPSMRWSRGASTASVTDMQMPGVDGLTLIKELA